MSMRYKGGIISATAPTSTTSTASGVWSAENVFQAIGAVTWPRSPAAPTIGTATDLTTGGSVSVAFTAPSDTGSTAITSYSSLSTPGSLSSSNSASPITATGLTNSTAYTFQVRATNSAGTGPYSGASNSVTPTLVVNYIEEVFQTWLYTGNGSTQTITNGIDLSTKGGLVWIKDRNSGAKGHALFDTARGVNKKLQSQSTNGEFSSANQLTAFNTTGFALGSATDPNGSGTTYVSWTFREQAKFFDIVTYTGTGSNTTIAHNLGSTPGCIIVKRTDTTANWAVYHSGLASAAYSLKLNLTDGQSSAPTIWNSTTPTSTVFSIGTDASVNASSGTYVAYLFADSPGGFGLTGSDSVIRCGSYTGSNNPSYPSPGAGKSITTGFEPQWVMIKNVTTGGMNWVIMDNMRLFDLSGYGWIFPNSSGAEQSGSGSDVYVSPTATGFRTYGNNATVDGGSTSELFVYVAIRRGPMKIPTVGTTVFKTVSRAGTNAAATTTGLGFPPDFVISKSSTTTYVPAFFDKLRGPLLALRSSGTNAEFSASLSLMSYDQDGLSLEADASLAAINFSGTYANWNFRRAPSFFDEVCYTGTGSATTFAHNLGVAPELMIVKRRDTTADWWVYDAATGNTKYNILNSTTTSTTASTAWNNTSPTSSVFSVGSSSNVNASAGTFVAYLFATCSGVSKVGTYTGTAALLTVNCGFTTGARFVLIKRTDDFGGWYTYDSVRGLSPGSDPYLLLNDTAAEVGGTNYVDTDTTGFKVTAAAPAGLNANGGTYIFLAIA